MIATTVRATVASLAFATAAFAQTAAAEPAGQPAPAARTEGAWVNAMAEPPSRLPPLRPEAPEGFVATQPTAALPAGPATLAFAADAAVPETWDCPRCGLPANLDSLNPPPPPKIEPYKTHLAYVKERRSDQEAADILTEALQALRARRARGDVIY